MKLQDVLQSITGSEIGFILLSLGLAAALAVLAWFALRWRRQAGGGGRSFERWEQSAAPVLLHASGKVISANPSFLEALGIRGLRMEGVNWLEWVAPGERQALAKRYELVLKEGKPVWQSYSVCVPGRSEPLWQVSTTLPWDWQGRPAVLEIFLAENNSEIKGQAHLWVEQYFRKLFESLPIPVCLTTQGGQLVTANQACADLFGYASPQVMLQETGGVVARLHAHPEALPVPSASTEMAANPLEVALRRRDGSTFTGRIMRQCHASDLGPSYCLTLIEDLSESVKTELALRESERRFERLFESSDLAIFESSLDGRLLRVNQAYASLHGYRDPAEVLAQVQDVARQIYANPAKRQEIIQQALDAGEMIYVENENRRKDGSIFLSGIKYQIMYRQDGDPDYIFGFIEDITLRKLAPWIDHFVLFELGQRGKLPRPVQQRARGDLHPGTGPALPGCQPGRG